MPLLVVLSLTSCGEDETNSPALDTPSAGRSAGGGAGDGNAGNADSAGSGAVEATGGTRDSAGSAGASGDASESAGSAGTSAGTAGQAGSAGVGGETVADAGDGGSVAGGSAGMGASGAAGQVNSGGDGGSAGASGESACDVIDGRGYESVEQLECGFGVEGIVYCMWRIEFDEGGFLWAHSDVREAGTYTCDGASIIGTTVGGGRELDGELDFESGNLVWDGVLYQP